VAHAICAKCLAVGNLKCRIGPEKASHGHHLPAGIHPNAPGGCGKPCSTRKIHYAFPGGNQQIAGHKARVHAIICNLVYKMGKQGRNGCVQTAAKAVVAKVVNARMHEVMHVVVKAGYGRSKCKQQQPHGCCCFSHTSQKCWPVVFKCSLKQPYYKRCIELATNGVFSCN
jgi:hypothetical protein